MATQAEQTYKSAADDFIFADSDNISAFPEQTVDNLMHVVIALGAELWTVRRRMMTLEKVLEKAGVSNDDVEKYLPAPRRKRPGPRSATSSSSAPSAPSNGGAAPIRGSSTPRKTFDLPAGRSALCGQPIFSLQEQRRCGVYPEYDVIVVGAGTAGIPAALGAVERGLKVALVEAAADIGGTLHLSSASISAGGTDLQRRAGIADSAGDHFADALRINHGTGDHVLLRKWTEEAGPMVDWLESIGWTCMDGVPTSPPNTTSTMSSAPIAAPMPESKCWMLSAANWRGWSRPACSP
ncbi:FAD-dependent oxidoreductase [Novosphingobium resinovorum]